MPDEEMHESSAESGKRAPFMFRAPPGLNRRESRKNVIIVGAGPIGLAAALELANHGIHSVVLDDGDTVATGSRAICWSKRSLEILDRIGIGNRAVDKGVTWKVGRTYHGDQELFSFDLLPEAGHKRPAFVNLQQFYVEQFMVDRATDEDKIDLRFSSRVVAVNLKEDVVEVEVETPAGTYRLEAEYVIACDGVRSSIRSMLGLQFEGDFFEDRFLITDIEMSADFPSERRFWFEPTFHDGQSALLHKQPDNIYRIDLQLGPHADASEERQPRNVIPRISRMVGTSDFRIAWVSVYTFQCRRLSNFVHGRVIFAGDSAHVVSPFGARGGNGGLQDIDSLCWRLAGILKGRSPKSVLQSYNRERIRGADENIANSTRTTKYMTPSDGWERIMRDQVLKLASQSEFARAWVNSGRLSVPCVYDLDAPDHPKLPDGTRPGSVAADAPQGDGWLMDGLGLDPVVLAIGCRPRKVIGCRMVEAMVNEEIRARYLGDAEQAVYLVRPDQVVAARWSNCDEDKIAGELARIWNN